MELLRSVVASEKPDLVIGTSMGGMYSEMLYGIDRIIVNPAFQLADTLLKNNGLGRREFHNKRADGETSFLVTKTLLEHFREVSSHCFAQAVEDHDRVFGLFGTRDNLVHTFDLFREHYPQAIHFDGEHHLNDSVIVHSLLPVIQRIDDRQNGTERPVIYISIDALRDERSQQRSSAMKAFKYLLESYNLFIIAPSPTYDSEYIKGVQVWTKDIVAVPAFEHLIFTNQRHLLLGDYLIDAIPCKDFMGTQLHFGDDTFKTWEDIIEFFSRLGGQ
jgi:hypothetical protein